MNLVKEYIKYQEKQKELRDMNHGYRMSIGGRIISIPSIEYEPEMIEVTTLEDTARQYIASPRTMSINIPLNITLDNISTRIEPMTRKIIISVRFLINRERFGVEIEIDEYELRRSNNEAIMYISREIKRCIDNIAGSRHGDNNSIDERTIADQLSDVLQHPNQQRFRSWY